MKLFGVLAVCLAVVSVGCGSDDATGPGTAVFGFADDFDDGVIDTLLWTFGGDITESGGNLNLNREFTDDFIQSVDTFSGDWVVELDIRLNAIHWNDMFHGVSIRNAAGEGITLGFSRYDKIYLGTHTATGAGFTYGPDGSNDTGAWQHWRIENSGGDITILIDGQAVVGLNESATVPSDARISLPGHYQDGDGGASVGLTSSNISTFSISRD